MGEHPGPTPPPFDARTSSKAMVIAMAVRNALERLHGGGIEEPEHGLTDEQMRRINPIVRDAVATTLHAMEHAHRAQAAREFLGFQQMLIPSYWEDPEFLEDYVELWKHEPERSRPDGFESVCRHCGRTIVREPTSYDPDRWTHIADDGQKFRGCRAASFTEERGWDDTIDRSLYAAPPRQQRRSALPTHTPTMAEAMSPGMTKMWDEVNAPGVGPLRVSIQRLPAARHLARWGLVDVAPIPGSKDQVVTRRHDAPDAGTTEASCLVCDARPLRRDSNGTPRLTCEVCHKAGKRPM